MSDEDGAKVGLLNRNLIRIRGYLKDGYSIGEIAHKDEAASQRGQQIH